MLSCMVIAFCCWINALLLEFLLVSWCNAAHCAVRRDTAVGHFPGAWNVLVLERDLKINAFLIEAQKGLVKIRALFQLYY